jgi:hypothetical protein
MDYLASMNNELAYCLAVEKPSVKASCAGGAHPCADA